MPAAKNASELRGLQAGRQAVCEGGEGVACGGGARCGAATYGGLYMRYTTRPAVVQ